MNTRVKKFDEGGYADEEDSFTVGWTDNGDGTWSYTDDSGKVRQFNEDGTEVGVGEDPIEVIGAAEEDPFEFEREVAGDNLDDTEDTEAGVPRIINGIEYTQREDGTWVDDEGITYSDDEIQAETDNPTNPDEVGAAWSRNPDGSMSQTRPDGLIITKNNDGTTTTQNPNGSTQTTDKDGKTTQTTASGSNPNGVIKDSTTTGGASGVDKLLDKLKKDDGSIDWTKILTAGVGIKGLLDAANTKNSTPDYQGQIDMGLTFNRAMNPQDPNRRPGSAGTPFFASNSFGPAGGIKAIMGQPPPPGAVGTEDMETMATRTEAFAGGGIARLTYAQGGTTEPRYIKGDTDGMADEVPATIDGKQPAAIAHGEFIWPADVVSHLGNGNSDAGAKKLYQAMDAIRMARTGTKKQGKRINPDKFIPGMKRMASGGITDVIPRFSEGGTAAVTGVNNWAGPYATGMLSQANAVGNDMIANAGNYVYQGPRTAATNATQQQAINGAANLSVVNPDTKATGDLQKGLVDRMANQPAYQAANVGSGYTAGPAYQSAKFNTTDFSQDAAKKYMDPYLKLSLDPQLAEARRQAEITRMTNAGRLVGSGAFGGGRQAIMEAEGDRNLGTNLASITGQGYNKAYDSSLSQFNADQNRRLDADRATEQSRQYGNTSNTTDRSNAANFGLQAAQLNETSRSTGARLGLDALQGAMTGASNYGNFLNSSDANARNNLSTINGIGNDKYLRDQAGLTADMNKFNEEAALPAQALKFKKDMLAGLPTTTTTPVSPNTSLAEQLTGLGLSLEDITSLFGGT